HKQPSTARSRLASSITMMTFLPPISRCTFLNDGAAWLETVRPTSVDPVNETTRTASLTSSALPTSAPPPVTRLTTPGGIPASSRMRTKFNADSGVSVAGLKTTVLPDQRRDDLPARDRHRKVPRRDDRGDADRLPHRHRELVAQLGRHRLAVLAAS